MLVQCKNPDLYRQWLTYYSNMNMLPAAKRTYAFFNSQQGLAVPIN